jgi:hypothetical protein
MSQLLDISDEELQKDIDDTMNEIEAYHLISTGFFILSNLSNVDEFNKRQYFWKHIKYKEFGSEADTFLHTLLDIKRQRTDKS